MAKKDYSLLKNYLNSSSQPELQTDEQMPMNLKMLSVYDLIPHPENKYDTDKDIDKLADEIEDRNDITPLDVKTVNNGKYMIISGHRRRKAILLLINQNRRGDNKVPCIINTYSDEAEERAAIVFKNSQREKSDEERAMEIELARPYLERKYKEERQKAKNEGRAFMKFRKYFADKLGVSEATIHREEAFKNVIPEIQADVETGKTTKTAVVAIASMNQQDQKAVYEAAKDNEGRVSVKSLEKERKQHKTIDEPKEDLAALEKQGRMRIDECVVVNEKLRDFIREHATYIGKNENGEIEAYLYVGYLFLEEFIKIAQPSKKNYPKAYLQENAIAIDLINLLGNEFKAYKECFNEKDYKKAFGGGEK